MSSQFPDLGVDVPEITAAELKGRLDGGESITLLDTRRPDDVEAWHMEHPNLEVENVPFTAFVASGETGSGDVEPVEAVPEEVPDGPLVCSCAKGISSQFVAEVLVREDRDVEAVSDGMMGWSRLYEARPVEADTGDATVVQYERPSSGCLAYLVVAGGEAAVIDPLRAFVERYERDARERGATVRYAVDTHVHADHVSGVRALAELADAEPVLPAGADDRGLAFDATLLADGDELALGDASLRSTDADEAATGSDSGHRVAGSAAAASLRAVALPGHTTEMIGFRVGEVLCSGDLVFPGGVARPDLEDADRARDAARRLHGTLRDLAAMDDGLVVAPGHAEATDPTRADGTYTARLGDLRDRLDLLGLEESAFVDRVTTDLPPRPENFERIIEANLGRTRLPDDEAFELELGPNNCAAG